jgi:hypothetical protein
LSAIGAAEVRRPGGLPVSAFSHAVLWFAVFLGGFVFFEPAPYELFLALAIPIWAIVNPKLPRAIAPLLVLMLTFLAGGLMSGTQAKDIGTQPIYYAVTGFLALSSCFYAAVLGTNPRLYRIVVNGWIVAAVITVGLGVIGYFGLSGELFTKFDRAAGGFQDPNVFGPFLAFPFVMLVRRVLTRPLGSAILSGGLAMWVFIGVFLSFSRAAWGLSVLTTMLMALVLYATERDPLRRGRYIGTALAGVVVAAMVLVVALSIPAISDLFVQRAQLVQDYDAEHLGRFARHAIGFNMMLDHPLGIGAMEFGNMLGEDEHDIWLKTLTTYGWLGFASYFTLVIWTLVAAFPLVFRTGPLQPVVQVAFIVFLGHILVGTVIDIDHWRHVYLLFGMLWGAIAADRAVMHTRLADRRNGNSGRAVLRLDPIT